MNKKFPSKKLNFTMNFRQKQFSLMRYGSLFFCLWVVCPAYALERIVSMAPNVTEILFILGVGDRLVGVTDYCDEPEAAKRITRIGGFINPNLEAIVAKNPDLVIAVPNGGNRPVVEKLQSLNVRVLIVDVKGIDQIYEAILQIGAAVGKKERAGAVVLQMQQDLIAIAAQIKDRPVRKVAVVYGRDPLYLAGKDTFADELIRLAGGINIASGENMAYPRYSFEELIVQSPEVIIDAAMGTQDSQDVVLAYWNRWQTIDAVQNKRIFVLSDDAAMIPGPRLPQALATFARCIHPEAFEKKP